MGSRQSCGIAVAFRLWEILSVLLQIPWHSRNYSAPDVSCITAVNSTVVYNLARSSEAHLITISSGNTSLRTIGVRDSWLVLPLVESD